MRSLDIVAMADQQFLKSVFAGDNAAFRKLYEECRESFTAFFLTKFPGTKVSLPDLYQDSVVEFWSQIIDGRITEDKMRCSLPTYIVSIGINKMHERFRGVKRNDKLVETLTDHPDSFCVSHGSKTPIFIKGHEEDDEEQMREWTEFLKEQYENLGFPCAQLLRYTWYDELNDSEIVDKFGGHFASTTVVKSKRYKCHKSLLNMFKAWKKVTQPKNL